jgi:hypothetical protein
MFPSQRFAANLAKTLLIALLAIPAIRSIAEKDKPVSENRKLAAFPAHPESWESVLKYPAQLDKWINDHFGYRSRFLALNNRIRYALFKQFPTAQVIEGQNGRIFLSTHEAHYAPFAAIHMTCGYQFSEHDKIAGQLNAFHTRLAALGMNARLLIGPSSPSVYPDELPEWLANRCRASVPPFDEITKPQRLTAAARSFAYFPLEEMRSESARTDVIPKTWFHWAGAGARTVVEKSVGRFWGIAPDEGTALKTKTESLPSDLSHIFPGVQLRSDIETIDFSGSGVEECTGGKCFPAHAGIMEKLGDVSRYRNPQAPKERLILVTDSFGRYIAGWYARYFRDVMHISTNFVATLNAEETQQLQDFLLQQAKAGEVVFVYHDAGVLAGRVGIDHKKIFAKSVAD